MMTPDVVGDPVNPFDDLDGDPVDDLACYCPQSFSGGGLYSRGNGLLLL